MPEFLEPQVRTRMRRKPGRKIGHKNKPQAKLVDLAGPNPQWGPAMEALPSDKHRLFVLAMYHVKPGPGAGGRAARVAGFGTSVTNAHSWNQISYTLLHDPRVIAALHEQDKLRLRAIAPRALLALENLVEDPKHKDHARGVGMALDRSFPVTTHVAVEHRHVHEISRTTSVLTLNWRPTIMPLGPCRGRRGRA